MPLKLLGVTEPWADKAMLLNPVLNDGGYTKRGQWGWTTTGESVKKSRSLWGLAAFEPASPPPVDITVGASVDSATKLVTVAGQTLNVHSRDVAIIVTDANGRPAHIDQQPSDGTGHYSFTFPINGDVFGDGEYTVTVGGDGAGRANRTTFHYSAEEGNP